MPIVDNIRSCLHYINIILPLHAFDNLFIRLYLVLANDDPTRLVFQSSDVEPFAVSDLLDFIPCLRVDV